MATLIISAIVPNYPSDDLPSGEIWDVKTEANWRYDTRGELIGSWECDCCSHIHRVYSTTLTDEDRQRIHESLLAQAAEARYRRLLEQRYGSADRTSVRDYWIK